MNDPRASGWGIKKCNQKVLPPPHIQIQNRRQNPNRPLEPPHQNRMNLQNFAMCASFECKYTNVYLKMQKRCDTRLVDETASR